MNKLLAIFLSLITLDVSAKNLTAQDFATVFKNYDACFILYNLKEQKIVSKYNPNNYCNKRLAPDSTFKIPLSLMAFNQGIINQKTIFKWDGIKREYPDWNQNLTPATWLKYSSVWVSQLLTPQLGEARIKAYLANFHYGNKDVSGDPGKNNGLRYAWLSSSLKISAYEQLNFLKAMLSERLALSEEAVLDTIHNMYQGKLENGADYYGKTGSGRHGRNERLKNPSKLRDGWFVGFVYYNKQRYIFVSNLTDKVPASKDKNYGVPALTPPGSVVLKPISVELLNKYFSEEKHQ